MTEDLLKGKESAQASAESGSPDDEREISGAYYEGTVDDPELEPVEEPKYVYQKGDGIAFILAALHVFLPIFLAFFGLVCLIILFFTRC